MWAAGPMSQTTQLDSVVPPLPTTDNERILDTASCQRPGSPATTLGRRGPAGQLLRRQTAKFSATANVTHAQ
jgi:hypothetical protein